MQAFFVPETKSGVSRKWTCFGWVLLGWLGVVASSQAGMVPIFGTNEQTGLHRALGRLNMSEQDAGFDKDVAKPLWALDWVRATLRDPLRLPREGDRLLQAAESGGADDIWRLAGDMFEAGTGTVSVAGADASFASSNALSPHLTGYLREFVDRARQADDALKAALAGLTPEEKRYVAAVCLSGIFNAEDRAGVRTAMTAAGIASQDVQRVIAEGVELDPEPTTTNFLATLRRVNVADIVSAGRTFLDAVRRVARQSATVTEWPASPVTIDTVAGPVVVGTMNDDVYAASALLILDPGGNDLYGGSAGAANGLTGRPLAAIADLAGRDRYEGGGILGAGSALFGLAVLFDGAGDDRYQADFMGQGAAIVGAAWLDDRSGDDTYKAWAHAQGAATMGVGVLEDADGDDVYEIGLSGQGYASVRGFGLLLDRHGNDRYLAGNREPDWDRSEDRFLSLRENVTTIWKHYMQTL